MEKERVYTYQGFTFRSEAELAEAKKEAEVVAYIRGQADLSNVKTVVKLYNRLIEKGTLTTELGITFLKELRSRAIDSGVVAESSLESLPTVEKKKPEPPKVVSKDRKLMELYRERSRNLAIVVAMLCVVIVVLFAIRLFGTASPFTDYEQKVLDEYAGWKEELTEKEEALHLWEERLSAWEEELAEREAVLP
ncbi:MAG: hypothetical protein J6J38_05180 [Lachnospiraceae bacterium]|nr:hypothetical protein [Lachnospiraceae bacterium]